MPIASLAMLVGAVGQAKALKYLDDNNSGLTSDPVFVANLTQICAEVDGEIAGYVGRQYDTSLVFANPPPPILAIARKLLVHAAVSRKIEMRDDKGDFPSTPGYKEAQASLAAIGKGAFRIDVGDVPTGPAGNAGGGGATYQTNNGLPPTPPFFSGSNGGLF